MKILVNAAPMAGLLTGIARYLRNLYAQLETMEGVEVMYYMGNTVSPEMPGLADAQKWQKTARSIRKLPAPLLFGLRAARWYQYEYGLNRTAQNGRAGIDLLHETGFTPARFTAAPSLFSMYDLTLRRYQETQPKERVMLFEYFMKTRLAHADHILTISEFVRQEIIDEFKVSPSMVTAVHLAPDPLFAPSHPGPVETVLNRYRLPREYLVFVSSLEPRKNIDLLIEAMAMTRTDIPLVLVGWQGWGEKPWLEKIQDKGLKNRIYFTGHLPDNDLKHVYAGATALVYPSLYEGFGLPILEAMACGCPVICSNAASMPEVAKDAAILIDPYGKADLASAIDTVVHDSDKRKFLIEQGILNAGKFTWEKTARKTLEVFKKVVS